ncbi:MAG: sensor histidine kinase [Methylotenera sp.]|nr:sensor histidine kinase [Methylotenera sp.]
MRKPLTVRQLLLLAFLIAGLLPAMLVSFLSFYQARSALKSEIMHDMQTLSTTVANNVERMMFERLQNVHSWSQLAVMQELRIGDVDKQLATFLQASQQSYGKIYNAIEVVNTDGVIIASSHAPSIGQKADALRPWFNAKISSQTLSVAQLEHQVLVISQDIIAPETGQVIGRLRAKFNWQIMQDLLNRAEQNATAVALLDEQHQRLATTPNWDEINPQHGMHATSQLSSEFVPAWQVQIEKLHSVAVAPVHRLGYVFLALLLTTLILAIFLVAPIAQAITQPLSQLTHYVRQFAQGKSSSPPKTGPPEVRELGVAFEKLLQDLEKSQSNLTRAAKLAVVGEMAAAMSHEVRTPLGILRSSADVLQREPQLSKEGHEVLGFIISETERLNKLVSTLIDAARPRLPVFAELNLTELVSRTIALLKTQAQAKNISIKFSQRQKILAYADSDQITQVLMNLLMNAIQILPQGGQVEISLDSQADKIVLSVADNGPGISSHNQSQIFEPFFTQRSGGVGLGLAVVRQIVQAHGGEISYQPSQANGAEFIVTLPHFVDNSSF